jgi:hypothetical protein
MTQTNSLFPQIDPVVERRRGLSKVYRLLIRLADEADNHTPISDNVCEEDKKMEEPIPTDADTLTQGILPFLDSKVSSVKTE